MRSETNALIKVFSILAVLVLIAGLLLIGTGLAVRHHRSARSQATATAFKIVRNQTFYPNEGNATLQVTFTRLQRGDGSWKDTADTYDKDGSIRQRNHMFGITGLGVFAVDEENHTLVFQSQKLHAAHWVSEDATRKDPTYIGDQAILGYRCLGQREPDDTETWLSPQLAFPLKQVIKTANGRIVTEAVRIDLGEPSDTEFGTFPNYSVDYSYYERLIANTERQGQRDLANQMRQIVGASKQRIPQGSTLSH
jgi:hypothetical protein